jgi:hypothetical protein
MRANFDKIEPFLSRRMIGEDSQKQSAAPNHWRVDEELGGGAARVRPPHSARREEGGYQTNFPNIETSGKN